MLAEQADEGVEVCRYIGLDLIPASPCTGADRDARLHIDRACGDVKNARRKDKDARHHDKEARQSEAWLIEGRN
ncbi:hypothetical protein [Actinoplanes sp. NPDC048796]|uniref:hypothetical protein n=1 Tax=Actinoplanes sp. NPDC048796 TaxID=3155640 RepID=UPI0033FE7776